jgi:hypothetical protein
MAFCKSKVCCHFTPEQSSRPIDRIIAKRFKLDQSGGGPRGGWCRYILAPASYNYVFPEDKTSITAPGARWIQVSSWDAGEDLPENIKVEYSVIGLVRDSNREQHECDLCPKIRVRIHRRGPSAQCPEWMAAYGRKNGFPQAPSVFEGDQLQTVTRFSKFRWICRWHHEPENAFPFRGYWMDDANDIAYVPEPLPKPDYAPGMMDIAIADCLARE